MGRALIPPEAVEPVGADMGSPWRARRIEGRPRARRGGPRGRLLVLGLLGWLLLAWVLPGPGLGVALGPRETLPWHETATSRGAPAGGNPACADEDELLYGTAGAANNSTYDPFPGPPGGNLTGGSGNGSNGTGPPGIPTLPSPPFNLTVGQVRAFFAEVCAVPAFEELFEALGSTTNYSFGGDFSLPQHWVSLSLGFNWGSLCTPNSTGRLAPTVPTALPEASLPGLLANLTPISPSSTDACSFQWYMTANWTSARSNATVTGPFLFESPAVWEGPASSTPPRVASSPDARWGLASSLELVALAAVVGTVVALALLARRRPGAPPGPTVAGARPPRGGPTSSSPPGPAPPAPPGAAPEAADDPLHDVF